MNDLILAVIGGGSVNWMRPLMRDVYLLEGVSGGEIRLVDPNREHVEAVAAMLERFNRESGRSFAVRIAGDRREALRGANIVLATFSPGAMDAFWNDLELPVKYGVRLPVSMTVGIPGISAALRTVPVAEEIVRDMEDLCPSAWLINVTNPMTAVTAAMARAARTVRVVGMCHEFHCLPSLCGPLLGLTPPAGRTILDILYRWLPEQGLDYAVAGINHFIWLNRARRHGEDLLPGVRAYAAAHDELGDQPLSAWANRHQAKLALCRQFGLLPLAGDRHLVEFWPALCNAHNGWGMGYGVVKTTVDARRHGKDHQLAEIRAIADGSRTLDLAHSEEEMTMVIRAALGGPPCTAIVNAVNRGQVANLPEGAVVETLAEVDASGIRPRPAGCLPEPIAALCRLHLSVIGLTLEAGLTGSRDLLVQALSLDPTSSQMDFRRVPELAEDLLDANRAWLPRFFP